MLQVLIMGIFWVVASDEFGCEWISDTIFFQLPNPPNDIDGDGIVNSEDDDIDGDGIVNSEDDDVDGDGILNDYDDDIDGDGIVNENDDTISGYLNSNNFISINYSIDIFPNPTDGVFNLKLNSQQNLNAQLLIFNIEGRKIYDKILNLDKNENKLIDISNHKSGIYFIYLNSENKILLNKTIKIQK